MGGVPQSLHRLWHPEVVDLSKNRLTSAARRRTILWDMGHGYAKRSRENKWLAEFESNHHYHYHDANHDDRDDDHDGDDDDDDMMTTMTTRIRRRRRKRMRMRMTTRIRRRMRMRRMMMMMMMMMMMLMVLMVMEMGTLGSFSFLDRSAGFPIVLPRVFFTDP